MEGQEVLIVLLEFPEEGIVFLQLGQPGGDYARLGRTVPKTGLGGVGFEFFYFPRVMSGVKDNPSLR